MTIDEICAAIQADLKKKADASIDVRQHAIVFGDTLRKHVPSAALTAHGKGFDVIYASVVTLDARDVGASGRLVGYLDQLMRMALTLGAEMSSVEKTYFAFWR